MREPPAGGQASAHMRVRAHTQTHTHTYTYTHTLTQLRRPWRAPLSAGGPRLTATRDGRRLAGPGLGFPGLGFPGRVASRGDKPAGGLPLASSQRHPGGGRATLAPDPRGGSGSDDSNDGCRRFTETEPRRAESSEGEVLSPRPISACPGDSRPPLRASPQQPAD